MVERVAEGAESIGGFHDARIMHLRTDCCILLLPEGLKRKLRAWGCSYSRSSPTHTCPSGPAWTRP